MKLEPTMIRRFADSCEVITNQLTWDQDHVIKVVVTEENDLVAIMEFDDVISIILARFLRFDKIYEDHMRYADANWSTTVMKASDMIYEAYDGWQLTCSNGEDYRTKFYA